MVVFVIRSEGLRKKKLGDESFNQVLAEVKASARDQDEELRLLTERVVLDLFHRKPKKGAPQSAVGSSRKIPKKKRTTLLNRAAETDSMKAIESLLTLSKKGEEGRKDINGTSTATAAESSSSLNRYPSAFGTRKKYVTLKFRNVQIVRFQTDVSVV